MHNKYHLILTLISMIPIPALSALIEADFIATGDSLLTQDTDSRLEWLDITYAQGAGRMVLEGGYKDLLTVHGFRYATQTELSNLFSASSIYDLSNNFTQSNYTGVQTLQSLIGITNTRTFVNDDWIYGPITSGIVDFDNHNTFQSAVAKVQILDSLPIARATLEESVISDNTSSNLIGNYLVREIQPVPVPPALYLFISGIIGMLSFNFKKT